MALSRWAQSLAGLSLMVVAAGGALSVGGCIEAEARFFVECATGPVECTASCDSPPAQGSFNAAACGVTQDGAATGVCGYEIAFVIENGMVSSLDFEANNNRAETSEIIIYAYDLRIDGVDTPAVEGATILVAVEPEGKVCVPLTIISGSVDVGATGVVNTIAAVKFYGRTTGGLEVETPEQYVSIAIYNDPLDCSCEDASVAGQNPGSDGAPIRCVDCPAT